MDSLQHSVGKGDSHRKISIAYQPRPTIPQSSLKSLFDKEKEKYSRFNFRLMRAKTAFTEMYFPEFCLKILAGEKVPTNDLWLCPLSSAQLLEQMAS